MNQLKDTTIRHAVLLEQLKAGELDNLQNYYRKLDQILRERLTRQELNQLSRRAYKSFLNELENDLTIVLQEMADQIEQKTTDIATYEVEFEHKNLTNNLGGKFKKIAQSVLLATLAIVPIQVAGAVSGKTIAEAIKTFPNEAERLINSIKVGVAQSKTNSEIITSIRGTKANSYTDGTLNVVRNGIDSTVKTIISHSVTVAKEGLYKANDDVVEYVQWVSTLDRRTTATCRYLDGKIFKKGEGPRPPIHYNCRSTIIPVSRLSATFTKSRASETGQVDGDITYYEWLKQQPIAFQDQALGKTRGQLFRDGGLTSEQFAALQLDRNFKPITLERMKELEPLAFERAGLSN